MKMIKLSMALMVVFALALPVQVFGQCVDQNGDDVIDTNDYPVAAPTSGGCGDYDDCNGNGAYDVGEPCHEGGDHPTSKGDHPTGEAESEHEEDCAPRDDFHANCGAICAGMTEYWVDRDGDCEAEDGPFATWSEPTCPACPDDDDH